MGEKGVETRGEKGVETGREELANGREGGNLDKIF